MTCTSKKRSTRSALPSPEGPEQELEKSEVCLRPSTQYAYPLLPVKNLTWQADFPPFVPLTSPTLNSDFRYSIQSPGEHLPQGKSYL